MPHILTKKQLLQELKHHYTDDSLLVVDIWSSADVELAMQEPDTDKSMDIWVDIAEEFATAFEHTTSILNDTLAELVWENE
jgi:hypothetical protein